MDKKLSELAAVTVQRTKATGYVTLLEENLQNKQNLMRVVQEVVTQDHVGLVIGRQVISELVKALETKQIKDDEARREIIQGTLDILQPRIVSYDEQVTSLRLQMADYLEQDEDWTGAARMLMGIQPDVGSKTWSDEEKLKLYIRIIRLLLEEEDSVQAEAYYKRAALFINSTSDRELQLMFKLCQARMSDFSRRFLEAAMRYHELSCATTELDAEECNNALQAAITCAVLAPAGPSRSRVLASLYRDERAYTLSNYNILTKMFLDHIIRPTEVKVFEATLRPHQLAKIGQSSNDRLASRITQEDADTTMADAGIAASTRTGPQTVLDRAVMEHNILSCSNIYNNISFSGLGALLDVTPGAAETMARKMIEQGRLRGHIDQVEKLIWFEGPEEDDAQGKAGGLGDVDQATEETGAPYTKKWDHQIRGTAATVEDIVQKLLDKGLIQPAMIIA
ncbi:hypothetical protein M408DRAFT_328792 [Serendipita vermifera MAFF 305830]|uniref:COP9 signalosome complex subunit 4 n=1 Tax=Serendipita vermifera MAFF 305830 TaxID=933852 RepID=A0A0C2XKI1_SERVB|nr:hypothetical protein M408DRAFT_328792 [Serendipita vermifera MAFF 305830]